MVRIFDDLAVGQIFLMTLLWGRGKSPRLAGLPPGWSGCCGGRHPPKDSHDDKKLFFHHGIEVVVSLAAGGDHLVVASLDEKN